MRPTTAAARVRQFEPRTDPLLLDERDLLPLGEDHRGRRYWQHVKLGELLEDERPLSDDDQLPDRPLLVVRQPDGTRSYRAFRQVEVGSYHAAQLAPAPKSRPEPQRLVDALAQHPLLAGSPDRVFPIGSRSDMPRIGVSLGSYVPGRKPAHGPAAIIERLARKGIGLELSPDRAHLLVRTVKGRLLHDERELIELARPLLIAHLAGEPLQCAACAGEPAVTLGPGGAPLGAECLGAGA